MSERLDDTEDADRHYPDAATMAELLDGASLIGAVLVDGSGDAVLNGTLANLRPQDFRDAEAGHLWQLALDRHYQEGHRAGALYTAALDPPNGHPFGEMPRELRQRALAAYIERAASTGATREIAARIAVAGRARSADQARQALEDQAKHELALLAGERLVDGGAGVVQRLRGLADRLARHHTQAVPELTIEDHLGRRFLDETEALVERRYDGIERPLTTGLADLDAALSLPGLASGGLLPGSHMLVGGTGTGKSQLGTQIALHAAQHCGAAVWYSALELGRRAMVMRFTAMATEDPAAQWSRYWWGAERLPRQAADRWAALPIYIEQAPPHGWAYDHIERRAHDLRAKHPDAPLLMIVDFVQLVASPSSGERQREDLRERIGRAGYAARAVAERYDVSMLLISSTARDNYERLDFAKNPADFTDPREASRLIGLGKESGELEFAADTLLVLGHAGPAANPEHSRIVLAVAKQRAARSAWVPLTFTGSRFLPGELPAATFPVLARDRSAGKKL